MFGRWGCYFHLQLLRICYCGAPCFHIRSMFDCVFISLYVSFCYYFWNVKRACMWCAILLQKWEIEINDWQACKHASLSIGFNLRTLGLPIATPPRTSWRDWKQVLTTPAQKQNHGNRWMVVPTQPNDLLDAYMPCPHPTQLPSFALFEYSKAPCKRLQRYRSAVSKILLAARDGQLACIAFTDALGQKNWRRLFSKQEIWHV